MIKRILAGAAGLFRRTFEVTQLCHRVERSVCAISRVLILIKRLKIPLLFHVRNLDIRSVINCGLFGFSFFLSFSFL